MSKIASKIALVVNSCNECPHLSKFDSNINNHDRLYVCKKQYDASMSIDNPFPSHENLFIVEFRGTRDQVTIKIPDNCPLENFEAKEVVK